MNIEWTKGYHVACKDGFFRAFVSKHGSGEHYATVLYYKRRTAFNVAVNEGLLDFKSHTEFGQSEDEALNNLNGWIRANVTPDFTLKPMEDWEMEIAKS